MNNSSIRTRSSVSGWRFLIGAVLSAGFLLLGAQTAHAISLTDVTKPFTKATDWVAERSGVKPSGDNINEASRSATATAKEVQQAVAALTPEAKLALISVTRTSDAAGDLVIWIKWPLVVGVYCGAVWLASLAFRGWSQSGVSGYNARLPDKAEDRQRDDQPVPAGLQVSRRFVLIGLGSLAVFIAVFAVQLGIDKRLSVDTNLVPYLAVAGFRSLIAALLLFWIPIARAWMSVGLGVTASLAMFAVIAFGPAEPAAAQQAPALPSSATPQNPQ